MSEIESSAAAPKRRRKKVVGLLTLVTIFIAMAVFVFLGIGMRTCTMVGASGSFVVHFNPVEYSAVSEAKVCIKSKCRLANSIYAPAGIDSAVYDSNLSQEENIRNQLARGIAVYPSGDNTKFLHDGNQKVTVLLSRNGRVIKKYTNTVQITVFSPNGSHCSPHAPSGEITIP